MNGPIPLIRRFMERRGVPRDLLDRVASLGHADQNFWMLLLRFLLEHGLPALIEFLQNLLEERENS